MATYISMLPDDIRRIAIKRRGKDKDNDSDALVAAFGWIHTPEGFDYWDRINLQYDDGADDTDEEYEGDIDEEYDEDEYEELIT